MKRGRIVVAMCVAVLSVSGCANGAAQGSSAPSNQGASSSAVVIKQSPDKYTWYIKNYVGMNAAAVGYTALDTLRHDAYGAGNIKIVYQASDGAYLDPQDEEVLKEYKVTGQNLAPNTTLTYTFQLDENGEEYDSLVATQNYDEIVLAVVPVDSSAQGSQKLKKIEPSPDKYTRYVKDYVGRNLAMCGYLSLGQTYNDKYGYGFIKFEVTAEDGSYVDVKDASALADYVVTAQNVEPNTPITMTFQTKEDGSEWDSLVASQSLNTIGLTVKKRSA